jgi:hypothetical protein
MISDWCQYDVHHRNTLCGKGGLTHEIGMLVVTLSLGLQREKRQERLDDEERWEEQESRAVGRKTIVRADYEKI